MALPFEFDTRFLYVNDYIGEDQGLTKEEVAKYRSRGARCLREMRKAKKAGLLPQYARDRKIRSTVREILSHAERLGKGCETLVIVGIGGSTIGSQAILEALLPSHWNQRTPEQRHGRPRVHFFDNVDPDEVEANLELIDFKSAVACYISKSGTTAEVLANYALVMDRMRGADPEGFHKRSLVITGSQDSYLRREAEQHSYRLLAFPENLGGRWSVLSPVALFPAAMCGIDIGRLIDGATEVELLCTESDVDANPALNAALHYYLMDVKKKKKIHVLFHYSSRLSAFARWFRQLWAESLGKAYHATTGKELHVGTLPVPSLGPADQHSMLQLYLEGPADKVVTFLSIAEDRCEVKIPAASGTEGEPGWLLGRSLAELRRFQRHGTTYALTADGRPTVDLRVNRLDEFSLGSLFYFWELIVSYLATLYGVNAYDQPAVELGKWASQALLGDPEHVDLKEEVASTLGIDESGNLIPGAGLGSADSDDEDENGDEAETAVAQAADGEETVGESV